jgi:hypothetical protein
MMKQSTSPNHSIAVFCSCHANTAAKRTLWQKSKQAKAWFEPSETLSVGREHDVGDVAVSIRYTSTHAPY